MSARFVCKRLLFGAAILALSGCALVPAHVNQIEENLAQTIVASAERTICRDLPIGTWLRLYGASAERLDGWQKLCTHPVTTPSLGK